ncbi:hypothetical protein SAMD00019534_055380, partial [Acytostelium subglobosum LB1]|uniref:hypothetical protein n=1 Tax=Acytostelium subglobosum LB1 TaxID=1410327 RepID=UPI0006449F7E
MRKRSTGQNPGHYSRIPWWTRMILVDWAVCIGVVIFELIVCNFAMNPYDRYIPDGLDQFQTIQYPLKASIVPTWMLALIVGLIPLIVFTSFYARYRSLHDLHHACLGLVQALTMTMLFTDFLKVIVGRYRPDYAARVADGDKSSIHDGRLSFPSGHSSASFCSMTFLSMYLCGKLRVFRKEGSPSWKLFIVLLPYAISSFVAVSRTMDYHHDFSDILGGTLIGLCFGGFIYFNNFNQLSSNKCALPKNRLYPNYSKDGLLLAEKDTSLLSIKVLG